jgi:hypothetical protein
MNRETVSVVIPYYPASQTIARAVESALAQTVAKQLEPNTVNRLPCNTNCLRRRLPWTNAACK